MTEIQIKPGAKTTTRAASVAKPATTAPKSKRPPRAPKKNPEQSASAPPKPSGPEAKKPVNPEERYRMIAEAAYFRAERRGFAAGYELQDWLEAEAEIDKQL